MARRCSALALFFFAFSAQAGNFNLGVGGTYSYVTFKQKANSNTSIYHGHGFVVRPEFSIPVGMFKESSQTISIFGQYGKTYMKNTSVAEKHNQDYFGGGIDLKINWFLIGMQYNWVTSSVELSNAVIETLKYNLYGARAGIDLMIGEASSVSLVAIYQGGTAILSNNTTVYSIKDMMAVLMFRFNLMGDSR